jgi:hypothetical protein
MEETSVTESTPQTCAFPGCDVVMELGPEKGPNRTGPTPRYCDDPEHNTQSVFQALQRGEGDASPETEAGLGLDPSG